MKGKVVFTTKAWPYLIDDKQKRHDLRILIRGICGGIAGLIASLVVNFVFDKPKDIGQCLLYALVYGLMFAFFSVVVMGIACLLGKPGCNVFYQENKE